VIFTIYSRQGCHLCEEMLDDLLALVDGHDVQVRVVDVDDDEETRRRYGLRIPVLACDGEEVCSARIVAERVRALLGG
jgi:glutaredoxin